jgi:hypothetical protein
MVSCIMKVQGCYVVLNELFHTRFCIQWLLAVYDDETLRAWWLGRKIHEHGAAEVVEGGRGKGRVSSTGGAWGQFKASESHARHNVLRA